MSAVKCPPKPSYAGWKSILRALSTGKKLSAVEIAAAAGLSVAHVRGLLGHIHSAGHVRRWGAGSNISYTLTPAGLASLNAPSPLELDRLRRAASLLLARCLGYPAPTGPGAP